MAVMLNLVYYEIGIYGKESYLLLNNLTPAWYDGALANKFCARNPSKTTASKR